MDEYHGSGRDDNGGHGLAPAGVFGSYNYHAGKDRRHPAIPIYDVHGVVLHGAGIARQDDLYGSWIGAPERSADGERAAEAGTRPDPDHVQPMPDVQTPLLASLPNMQSVHIAEWTITVRG